MRVAIHKVYCDRCGKVCEETNVVKVEGDLFGFEELCQKCSRLVLYHTDIIKGTHLKSKAIREKILAEEESVTYELYDKDKDDD